MSSKSTGYKRKRSYSTGRLYPKKKISFKKTRASSSWRKAPRYTASYGVAQGGTGFAPPVRMFTTGGQKKASLAEALKGEYAGMSDPSQDLILSILDPEMCMNPQRWPNTYGTSALFKSKNVIEANFTAAADAGDELSLDNTARSTIIVYPQMKNAIFTTQASKQFTNFVLTKSATTSGTPDNLTPFLETSVSLSQGQRISVAQPFIFPGNKALFPFPNKTTRKLLYAINTTSGAGGADTGKVLIMQTNAAPGTLGITATVYTRDFVQVATFGPTYNRGSIRDGAGDVGINVWNPSTLLNLDVVGADVTYYWIAIELVSRTATTVSADVRIGIYYGLANQANTSINVFPVAQFCDAYSIANAETVEGASDEAFVIAQSLLATFEGSSLNNAGQLAIARVPPRTKMGIVGNVVVNVDNWYQYIADLPLNNYNGPTKKGGYAWYLSTDEEGYFYSEANRNINIKDSYIVLECTTSDTTNTAIRYMVNSIVQFCTNSTAFNQAPSEFIGDDIEKIRHLLSNIPAAYENPTHRQQLTNMLKNIGSQVWKIAKNPETYRQIGEAIKAARAAAEVVSSLA